MKRKSVLHPQTPWNHSSEGTTVIEFFTHTHTHTHTHTDTQRNAHRHAHKHIHIEAVCLYKIFFYVNEITPAV